MVVIIYILSFEIMDALNSCFWWRGKLQVMSRRVAVFGVMMDCYLRG